ncbi:MAG: glycosyltransferase family 2 protein [Elusimicrobia bacterium]|nr:glycosyltransferase family 2 protein [Elusimicrobiota bacterium]
MVRLSAIIIAKDEEEDLPGALESLKGLADEIVVLLDTASSDRSDKIAEEFGAVVRRRPFDTYAGQKQAALELARGEWVLSLDADERASPELKEEMPGVLSQDAATSGYDIPFEVHFLGRRLGHGGLGRESHLRLFRRDKARFAGGALHEGVEVAGPVSRLRGKIIHRPYKDISEYVRKMDLYTDLAARKRFAMGARWRPWRHLILAWEFFCRAVLKLGFLDGQPGLVWAGLSAFHSWLKYVKLKELEKNDA